jgi:hypothetical protein
MRPSRPWALVILAALLLAAVAVPALVAYALTAGQVDRDIRVERLEQRIDRLETEVSLLKE